MILHVRRSQDIVLKHLRRISLPGGIAHAFNGSFQQAETFIGLGFRLGFGGAMTFPRARQIRRLAATGPASALVLECHRPEEKARVQSFNDFIVFGTVACGSLLSGSVLTAYGWNTVLWLSFVPLALAVLVLARSEASRRIGTPR